MEFWGHILDFSVNVLFWVLSIYEWRGHNASEPLYFVQSQVTSSQPLEKTWLNCREANVISWGRLQSSHSWWQKTWKCSEKVHCLDTGRHLDPDRAWPSWHISPRGLSGSSSPGNPVNPVSSMGYGDLVWLWGSDSDSRSTSCWDTISDVSMSYGHLWQSWVAPSSIATTKYSRPPGKAR